MDSTERSAAVFGMFDGVVSIVGFIFALMLNGSSNHLIAIGALGGAISAMVSMGIGQFESTDGTLTHRAAAAVFMAVATLVGSLVPVWGFFLFDRPMALVAAGIGSVAVAGVIGWAKHKGVKGYVGAFVTLLLAVGLTLGVIALLPSAG
jgi:VIT1/CCC1 family predicted Fe2+/Mn2+ transporter